MLKRALCAMVFAISLALITGAMTTGGERTKVKEKEKEKKFEPKYADTTYVPTADEVINKMFEMAKVTKDDVIFDLGCGDNRILYMAATKFGCRGVGVEINPDRIKESMDQYEKYNKGKDFGKLLSLVETRHGDAFAVKDLSDATVIVMYMFPAFMEKWFPTAQAKLKPGTRIVSHDYSWDLEKHPEMWKETSMALVNSSTREGHKVYLWIVPEKKKAVPNQE